MLKHLSILGMLSGVCQPCIASEQRTRLRYPTQLVGQFDCSDVNSHLVLVIELPSTSSQSYSYDFSWDDRGDNVLEADYNVRGGYQVGQSGRIPSRDFQFSRTYTFGWTHDRSQYVAGHRVILTQTVYLDHIGQEHSLAVEARISGVIQDGGYWGVSRLSCSPTN